MEKFLGSFADPDPVVIETASEVDSVAPVIANDDDYIELIL